ncbi:MAG: DUF3605 domain-containing protein [Candidatus Shapirobacteria bacterium]|nr:DUF3605 domain-containing protein [Candidatus Shapirobacteria bacterium]
MKLFNFDPPQTWDELVSLKKKIRHSIPEVNRFSEDLSFYELYLKLVPKDIRLEIISQQIGNNDIKLLKNNFPYLKLTQHIPGVVHYCLWSRIGKLSKKIIETEIEKKFPKQKYFWFENSTTTKSVPEIWHCQVFIKLK